MGIAGLKYTVGIYDIYCVSLPSGRNRRGKEDSVDLFLNYFNAHFQGQYVELVIFPFSDFKIFVLFNRVIR